MPNLLLRPRDPLIVRDARPFSADPGARAFTLKWPLPGTVAGALRTHVGNTAVPPVNWDEPDERKHVRDFQIKGPLFATRSSRDDPWTVYFPAPSDAVIFAPEGGTQQVMRLKPHQLTTGEGCNAPAIAGHDVQPVKVTADIKPDTGFDYWSFDESRRWLLGEDFVPDRALPHIPTETRIHVSISPKTLTSEEGRLFATEGLAFSRMARDGDNKPETAMLCHVTPPSGITWTPHDTFIPLGGERRQTRIAEEPALHPDPWTIPADLLNELDGQTHFRLQLVTPAIFENGWLPEWLTTASNHPPKALDGLDLKLMGAAIERRIPISGWDFVHHREKPTRYAVPAGGVYFFKLANGLKEEQIRRLWLAPISDRPSNRHDSFGLVVPGVWESASN